MAQQYGYIILNDGTKWRYKVGNEPKAASGPYRATTTDSTPVSLPVYSGSTANSAAKTKPSAKAQSNAANRAAASAEAAAKKAAAEAAAMRRAELEAAQKEKERKEKIAAINSSKEAEMRYLGEGYNRQKAQQKLSADDNMRQLYIAYMNGIKGIPQQSAVWGAGGEIESLKNRSRLNYEDNRAKEQRRYAGVLGEIEQKYNDDLRELESKYLQRLLNI